MPESDDEETLDAIEKSVRDGISRAQGDTGSIEEHPLPDRIDALRKIKSDRAARRGIGARFVKFVPPGAE